MVLTGVLCAWELGRLVLRLLGMNQMSAEAIGTHRSNGTDGHTVISAQPVGPEAHAIAHTEMKVRDV